MRTPDDKRWSFMAEIVTNGKESVVLGYEPHTDTYCTWLKLNKDFIFGHYSMPKNEAILDLLTRTGISLDQLENLKAIAR